LALEVPVEAALLQACHRHDVAQGGGAIPRPIEQTCRPFNDLSPGSLALHDRFSARLGPQKETVRSLFGPKRACRQAARQAEDEPVTCPCPRVMMAEGATVATAPTRTNAPAQTSSGGPDRC